MPTLLSVNNYHYRRGGAEVVFFEHNRLLAGQGWSVVPFCMRHPQNLPSDYASYFVEELEFGRDYSLLTKAAMAAKTVYSFEARNNLRRLLADANPDIAHCHNIYHHLSPSILHELRDHGIPTVMTLHDLKIACPAYKMLSGNQVCERCKGGNFRHVVGQRCIKDSLLLSSVVWLESTLHRWLDTYMECVDQFVVPSRFFRAKFVEWGWPEDKFTYIPNFINAEELKPRFEPGHHFLYFGRLGEEKGVDHFIRAAALAGVKAVVAGTGPLAGELAELAETVGADVDFLGHRTGEDLRNHVRSARAVVLPSLWYENAPLSILEAIALGKPVIGARIGGIPELIEEGITGTVFTSGSVDELAAAMANYRDMDDSRIAVGAEAGRARLVDRFSESRYVESVEDLYRSLLARRR